MKKIGKFRAWLIKILGGELPSENKPTVIIKECSRETQRLEESVRVGFYDKEYITEPMIKEQLIKKLIEDIAPFVMFLTFDDIERLETNYKAQLTIVKEQDNER